MFGTDRKRNERERKKKGKEESLRKEGTRKEGKRRRERQMGEKKEEGEQTKHIIFSPLASVKDYENLVASLDMILALISCAKKLQGCDFSLEQNKTMSNDVGEGVWELGSGRV